MSKEPSADKILERPDGYETWLADLKRRVHAAQQHAAFSVNREILQLYWQIGRDILERQALAGWGAGIVEHLATDLRAAFPEIKGFSRSNLMYMRAFAEAWPELETIVQQPVGQLNVQPRGNSVSQATSIVQQPVDQLGQPGLPGDVGNVPAPIGQQAVGQLGQPRLPDDVAGVYKAIVQQAVGRLPWGVWGARRRRRPEAPNVKPGHNIVLLTKLKVRETRLAYAQQALEHGWSRNALVLHIENRTWERQGKALTNFEARMPKPQSDLARESLKDPYHFDFLTLGAAATEREIESALVQQMTQFLLELGAGFAFVGRQVRIEVGGDEFYLDLLFYHLKLRAYVVIELKAGDFKPGDIGQLGFYLTAVDEQMKTPEDAPTIGLLLCKSKNRLVAEYALRNMTLPMGVAEYQLVEALPKDLATSLPSVEQIERELGGLGAAMAMDFGNLEGMS